MKLIHVDEPKHSSKIVLKKIKVILNIKPDVILFEFPKQKGFSLSYFNKFEPNKKPRQEIEKLKENYKAASKKYPWLKSEYKIFENIENLWNKGKQIYLFEVDAPIELTRAGEGTKGFVNLVWNYLREKYMIRNINQIERKMKNKTALIFCHNYHWKNIRFLLKAPNKKQIWNYYFTKNGITKSPREIQKELKKHNKILYKYWN